MPLSTVNIQNALKSLAEHRPVFHSEADFQHAFAWELHARNPEIQIRLEVPFGFRSRAGKMDIVARHAGEEYGIELKYKVRQLVCQVGGEVFALGNQAAQDLGRYDFFLDVCRLEEFTRDRASRRGAAIFLTNDSSYWKAPRNNRLGYLDFALFDGRTAAGVLRWGTEVSQGTRRNREADIELGNSYELKWRPFSQVESARRSSYERFQYLLLAV